MQARINRRALRSLTLIFLCVGGFLGAFPLFGLHINLSPSHVPVGLWRSVSTGERGSGLTNPLGGTNPLGLANPSGLTNPLAVGDVVAFDVQEFYAERPEVREDRMTFIVPTLLKRVAALPGSVIDRDGGNITIDGVPYRAPIIDESWVKVRYPIVVPDGCVWLMAEVESVDPEGLVDPRANAYDSRYHGPLPVKLIKWKAEPLLVR
ncbi:MAG: S26 family signal peptidase [Synergistaceae bacterium]|nr:S26 family signal peptidase [Synergistaceae bacterium]